MSSRTACKTAATTVAVNYAAFVALCLSHHAQTGMCIAGVISSLQEQAIKSDHIRVVYIDWAACLPKDTCLEHAVTVLIFLPNNIPMYCRIHQQSAQIGKQGGAYSNRLMLLAVVKRHSCCRSYQQPSITGKQGRAYAYRLH